MGGRYQNGGVVAVRVVLYAAHFGKNRQENEAKREKRSVILPYDLVMMAGIHWVFPLRGCRDETAQE
jgi:hypothetical protein